MTVLRRNSNFCLRENSVGVLYGANLKRAEHLFAWICIGWRGSRLNTEKEYHCTMGMPVITASATTRDQAITDLIQSVALEETALSHILNAEGEKIQKMVALPDVTPEVLLATNKSVESMVNAVSRLEMILQSKLSNFDGCL